MMDAVPDPLSFAGTLYVLRFHWFWMLVSLGHGGRARLGKQAARGNTAMIHYWIETALWLAVLFLIGCPVGAAARGLLDRQPDKDENGVSGDVSAAPGADR